MAQIHLKTPGQPVADFSLDGTTVTVAGVFVDCEIRQQDIDTVVEIRAQASGAGEGGDGAYIAQIRIPARQYVDEEIDEPQGEMTVLRTPVPLDPNAIEVTLWPRAAAPTEQL